MIVTTPVREFVFDDSAEMALEVAVSVYDMALDKGDTPVVAMADAISMFTVETDRLRAQAARRIAQDAMTQARVRVRAQRSKE